MSNNDECNCTPQRDLGGSGQWRHAPTCPKR